MSARTRELFGLIPVAILVTAGFAAVFTVDSAELSNLSLFYGAYFLALCLAAHLVIRARLPDADPYLFPLSALLGRLRNGDDLPDRRGDRGEIARNQANWFVIGLILFATTIVFVRDYEALERYRYVIASVGIALLLLPRFPGIGEQVNGAYLAVKIGAVSFQPAEFAKICLVVFLASYLREHREVLVIGARKVAGLTLPPLKHLGPLLVIWGASMLMLVFIRDLGSSLMFFAAFLALLYVATAELSFVVIGMAMFVDRRLVLLGDGRPCRRTNRHLAGPVRHGRLERLPSGPIPLRPGRRGSLRPGIRTGVAEAAGGRDDPAGPAHRPRSMR